MIITDNLLYRIIIDKPQRLLEFYWLKHEHSFTLDDFKEGSDAITALILKENPHGLIISFEDINYAFTYEMQQWFVAEIATCWLNSSLKKIALVVNYDLLIQHSVDAIIDETIEAYQKTIPNRFFSSIENAKRWILSS